MMTDYREQIKTYQDHYVYVKTGWLGKKVMLISLYKLSPLTFLFCRSLNFYGKANISIADDAKSAKVFHLMYSGISNCVEKYRGIVKEHAVSDLRCIKVYT